MTKATPDQDDRPMVSVIIPTYNSGGTLGACLASVSRQSYERVETIVVDGGSTDDTASAVAVGHILWISGDYLRGEARRKGAEVATGRYLLFLDSDQILSDSVIAECVDLVSQKELAAVKIPEVDVGEGIWAECRKFERNGLKVEALTYARFFVSEKYWTIGGHRRGIEGFLEDRDLFVRLRAAGGSWAWSSSPIINPLGRVGLLQLALKSVRTARDARGYYSLNQDERLLRLVLLRVRELGRKFMTDPPSLRVLIALPIYIALVDGVRALRAWSAELGRGD